MKPSSFDIRISSLLRQSGQTLIELLIASAVICTGLFAAASLVLSNLQLTDRDADEVTAINFAREGIEQAKQLRDSNWLEGALFDNGLYFGADDYSATPIWDGSPATASVGFDFSADDFTHDNTRIYQSENLNSPGFFTQITGSGAETLWRRLLTFHPICESAGGLTYKDDGDTCGGDIKIGIRVESNVQWHRKEKTFNRAIYEDIFDWR
jgi:Tfp pilus assembly protein PilV